MRLISHIIISTLLLNFLAACGGSSSDSPVSTDTNTIVDTNITVLHNSSFTSLHFSGSQNCAQCHDGIFDSTGKDVSIVKSWGSSMMANSAIDPLWRAKVASEVKRNPTYKEAIEEKCSRCHTPMATTEANFSGDKVALSGDGFLNLDNPHYDEALNGVSCTLCHQIENTANLGSSDSFSGGYTIADNTSTERKTYAQYTSPVTMPMQNNVQFTPAYSAHMNESKLCATCHNLDTPVIDAQGALNGSKFTEQAVYTEWEYSDFNTTKSCQDCHMPKTDGSVIISTKGSFQARSPFFQHQFIGANTYMLNIIKNNRLTLGATADTAAFEQTISNTKDFLMASADININSVSLSNGKLNFTVLVNNHSGHKFPTSYPSRRAWVHIKVVNQNTLETVFESGGLDADGRIIGVDDAHKNEYEPHYTTISDPSEVQVYEAVMADTDDILTYTLMHASRYLKDNRLLPQGFNKGTVPGSIQTFGAARTDADFIGGSDSLAYEVSLPESDYAITATLRYQTLGYGFAQDLYKDAELREVALMKALDSSTELHFEEISSDMAFIQTP